MCEPDGRRPGRAQPCRTREISIAPDGPLYANTWRTSVRQVLSEMERAICERNEDRAFPNLNGWECDARTGC